MFAGLFGVVLGSFLSTKLKAINPRADPLICAFGLLASTPLLFLATVVSQYNTVACYTLIFFGELFLNLNWSIVADMLLVRHKIHLYLCCQIFGELLIIVGGYGITTGIRNRFSKFTIHAIQTPYLDDIIINHHIGYLKE